MALKFKFHKIIKNNAGDYLLKTAKILILFLNK